METYREEEMRSIIHMGLLAGQALHNGHPYARHLVAVNGRFAYELDRRDVLRADLAKLQEAHRASTRRIAEMKRNLRRTDKTVAMLAERQRRIVAKL